MHETSLIYILWKRISDMQEKKISRRGELTISSWRLTISPWRLLSRRGDLLSRHGDLPSRRGELLSRHGELTISPRRVNYIASAIWILTYWCHYQQLICNSPRRFVATARYKGSNTGKKARRKNLRHPRERFMVSNEPPPSWRPIEIFPAGVWDFSVLPSYRCLILFLTNIVLKVRYFPSWDTPYMKYDTT